MSDHFVCDPEGYVRHWIVAGPARRPYCGPSGSEDEMRQAAPLNAMAPPPADAALNAPGPFGQPWRFYQPGANTFVECSGFWSLLEVLDLYAVVELHAAGQASFPARFWACGMADLWANGEHLLRHDVPRYMYPEPAPIALPLGRGANRLAVRLQALGVRDTRMLFGLQVLDGAAGLAIRLPGDMAAAERLVAAEGWLQGVRAAGRSALEGDGPAPCEAKVTASGLSLPWPAGQARATFDPEGAPNPTVSLDVAGQMLKRELEIPANRPAPPLPGATLAEHRGQHVREVAEGRGQVFHVLARRLLGLSADEDAAVLDATLKGIDERRDCADFTLAALLRLVALGLASGEEAERIRQTALRFRYWPDEPGTDAMCFGSENHSLLFHGSQWLAGRLYPDERFTNSGRTGAEQARLGAERCAAWLDETEPNGFREFLSASYMPITVAALMNLVDFSGDAALSRRAAALVDCIFRDLARHAFDGVTVGPQGRVYRNVLYPQTAGTQALLSYGATEAVVAHTPWLVFVASSKTYQPPTDLPQLMAQPASLRYRQDGVEIHLHKTSDYLLTSLHIPASFDRGAGAEETPANIRSALWPGKPGYQQHLWHATLGRDGHVFVNHPGCTFDLSSSRPGYWYGNGSLPRMAQREGMVLQIFDIPEAHPVPFTHAHWPADAFDREKVEGHWAFGAKGRGAIGLWCSQPLARHDEMLTGRELRAWGRRAAWLGACGSVPNAEAFEEFVTSCRGLRPSFDAESLRLRVAGSDGLSWGS